MSDEESARDTDDSRVERQSESGKSQGTINGQGAEESQSTDAGANRGVDTFGDDGEVQKRGLSSNSSELMQLLAGINVSEAYSGMLPRPKDFNQYSKDIQEKMCQWNDAFTVDESRRQDKLVDAEIWQSRKSMWLSVGLFFLTIVLAFVAFIVTENPWSFSLLSVPIVSTLANMFIPVGSQSSREHKKNKVPDE